MAPAFRPVQRTPSLWLCPPAQRPHSGIPISGAALGSGRESRAGVRGSGAPGRRAGIGGVQAGVRGSGAPGRALRKAPGGGAHGHGLCRGSPFPPRAVGPVPPWYVPGAPPPLPALEAAPFSQVSRERRSRIISRERARPALSAARAGRWRSARTSASPRAARRAPRRKCEGRRGTGGRCPGAPGGASRRRDAGDEGRMAAAARPERGRCCHGVSGRGAGGAGAAAGIRRGRFYCSPA